MKFAAAIFDLDGTIINDEDVWAKSYTSVLQSLGGVVSESNSHVFGASTEQNLKEQISRLGIKTDKSIGELVTMVFLEVQKLIPEMTLKDGVLDFMETLHENGTPLALATSSNWETTDKILEHFGLLPLFENITTVEEVGSPKPAPDIYVLASEKLGVEPADCLVFEDSKAGVTSAKEAGMRVIAVNEDEKVQETLEEADLVVSGFSEITLKAIDAIGLD